MHAARLQEARDRNPQILPYHNSLLALCRCGQVCALSSACFLLQGFDASHSVLGRWTLLVGNVPFEEVKCAPGASDPAAHAPYSVRVFKISNTLVCPRPLGWHATVPGARPSAQKLRYASLRATIAGKRAGAQPPTKGTGTNEGVEIFEEPRAARDAGAGMAGNPHGLACALLLRRRSPVSVASCARLAGAPHPRATVVCAKM